MPKYQPRDTEEDKAFARMHYWPMIVLVPLHLIALGSLAFLAVIVAVDVIAVVWYMRWYRKRTAAHHGAESQHQAPPSA